MSTRGSVEDRRKKPYKYLYINSDAYPDVAGIDVERMRQGYDIRNPEIFEPMTEKEFKSVGSGEYHYIVTPERTEFDTYERDWCSGGQEYVRGYMKKDGTYVNAYCRDKYETREVNGKSYNPRRPLDD